MRCDPAAGPTARLTARNAQRNPNAALVTDDVLPPWRPRCLPGRPLLGQLTDGLIIAAGHGREGLTAGPWSGLAVAQLALGQQPVTDLAPFDPSRFRA